MADRQIEIPTYGAWVSYPPGWAEGDKYDSYDIPGTVPVRDGFRHSVVIGDVHHFDDSGLTLLLNAIRGVEQIKEFCLMGFSLVTDKGFQGLSSMPWLEKLNLHPGASDRTMSVVAGMKKLKELEMYYPRAISARGFSHLKHLDSLELLRIEMPESIDQGAWVRLLEVVSKLPRIRSLILVACDNLNDAALSVLPKMKNLKFISIYGARLITDRTVQLMAKLPKIELVELTDCIQLTNKSLRTLEGMTQLEEVRIGIPGTWTQRMIVRLALKLRPEQIQNVVIPLFTQSGIDRRRNNRPELVVWQGMEEFMARMEKQEQGNG